MVGVGVGELALVLAEVGGLLALVLGAVLLNQVVQLLGLLASLPLGVPLLGLDEQPPEVRIQRVLLRDLRRLQVHVHDLPLLSRRRLPRLGQRRLQGLLRDVQVLRVRPRRHPNELRVLLDL